MVLDGVGLEFFGPDAFDRIVVEVQMRQLDLFVFERVHIHAEAVILAGDLDGAGVEILDRVVGAAMAEFELVGRTAEGQGQNLMAQTQGFLHQYLRKRLTKRIGFY